MSIVAVLSVTAFFACFFLSQILRASRLYCLLDRERCDFASVFFAHSAGVIGGFWLPACVYELVVGITLCANEKVRILSLGIAMIFVRLMDCVVLLGLSMLFYQDINPDFRAFLCVLALFCVFAILVLPEILLRIDRRILCMTKTSSRITRFHKAVCDFRRVIQGMFFVRPKGVCLLVYMTIGIWLSEAVALMAVLLSVRDAVLLMLNRIMISLGAVAMPEMSVYTIAYVLFALLTFCVGFCVFVGLYRNR